MRTDMWLRCEKAWNWVAANRSDELANLIAASPAEPEQILTLRWCGFRYMVGKASDFSSGHKTIGSEISTKLPGRLIRVQL